VDKKESNLTIIFTALLCLLINLFTHKNLFVGILNSGVFGLSLLFVYFYDKELLKLPLLFIFSLSLIPIFTFVPEQKLLYLFLASSITSWLMALKFKKYKYVLLGFGFLIYFWGTLTSNGIFTSPFFFGNEKIIFNVERSNQLLLDHQKGILFLPYPLRVVLVNKSFYIYSFFTNIAGLFKLRNLYDTLLLANIYPLILGFQVAYENIKKSINRISEVGVGLAMLAVGVTRSVDKFNSLFMTTPFLIYLIMLGFSKVNKKVYILLFVLSVLLLIKVPNI
jgi:hypothetical protein